MIKKVLFLIAAAFAFAACEGPMGPPGQDGFGANRAVFTVTVEEQSWQLENANGLNPYFWASVDAPEITNEVYKTGDVQVYLIVNPGDTQNEFQCPLNYSYPNRNQEGQLWTDYYSFVFMPGAIELYVDYSDFAEEQPPYQEFRVVVTW